MADEEAAPPPPEAEEAPPTEDVPPPPAEAPPAEEPPAEGEPPSVGFEEEKPPAEEGVEGAEVAEPVEGEAADVTVTVDDAEALTTGEDAGDEGTVTVDAADVTTEQLSQEKIGTSAISLSKKDSEQLSTPSETSLKDDTKKQLRSKGKAMGSIISIRKGSAGGDFYDRLKGPKYMNSYKLDSDKPFNAEKVEVILRDVLIEALDNLTYDLDKVPKQAKWASSAIRAKVKEQEYDRFKIICLVTIGEKRSQDVYSIFRFLWDAERDRFAKYTHENMHLFAVAICFAVYYE